MFNITTSTSIKLTIELDEQAARAILVDPASFQSELRARLGESHNGKHDNRDFKIRRNTRAPKGRGKAARTATGTSGRVRCQKCQRLIARKYMALHLRKLHPDSAGVAGSSD